MGIFGKILSIPIRLINAPLRAMEDLVDIEDDEERIVSAPLEKLAKEIERVDGDD